MLPMKTMAPLSLPGPPVLLSPLMLVALALAVPGCEPARGVPGAGPLAVEQARVDFGTVFEGAILEHEWELDVRAPVAIHAAKTDCGCTLAQLERVRGSGREAYELDQPLQPGERLMVRVRYDTRGRRGPAARAVTLGAVPPGAGNANGATASSLAPATGEGEPFVLTLAADVHPWLRIDPEDFEFARLREGQGAERAFEVRAQSGEPFALTASGRALPPWVTIELAAREPDAAGRARLWQGRVRLGSDAPLGTFSYPIELVSDVSIPRPAGEAEGKARSYSISPSWTLQVMGAVALSSPTLEFGLVGARETVARSVRLESLEPDFVPDAVQARLQPLHPDEPFLLAHTAQVRTRLVGRMCEIELTLAGLDPALEGSFLARLVIETGHPDVPRLEALVRGVRAPDGTAR